MINQAAEILDNATKPQAPVENKTGEAKEGAPPIAGATSGDERVSSKLEILIRREQAALERERFAKQREAELETTLAKIKDFESAKTNPKKALEMLGLNYDQLTQSVLNDGEVPPQVEIERLRKELEEYKAGQKQEKDQELESRKKMSEEQERQAITTFKGDIGQYVKDNTARYELIKFEQADELVFDVIDEHYKRTMDPATGIGKVMGIAEACDKVEAHLEKKYADSRGLGKVKTLWETLPKGTKEAVLKQAQNQAVKPPSQPPKTLTNTLAAQVSKPSHRPPEDQRISQIVAEFRNKHGF